MKNPLWQMFISHFFDRLIKKPKTIFGKLQAVGIFWIILLHQCDDGVDSNGAEKNVWDLIVTTIIEVDFRTFGVLWLAGSGCRSRTIKQNHCYSTRDSSLEVLTSLNFTFLRCFLPLLCLLLHFSLGLKKDSWADFLWTGTKAKDRICMRRTIGGMEKKTSHNGNNDAARAHLRFAIKWLFKWERGTILVNSNSFRILFGRIGLSDLYQQFSLIFLGFPQNLTLLWRFSLSSLLLMT